jgi:sporulation protein YlmC with PRC-barrel domain
MDTKRIKGLQVITLAGVKAGTVDRIFFDPATKRVAGFVLQADPALPADASPRLIEADDVHGLGADALIVPDDGAIRDTQTGTPLATLVDMNELAKRQVVTNAGTLLGQVAAIELDPQTLRLARVEVSAGFFKSNTWIPAEQVVRFGADAVMVTDAIAAPGAPTAMPAAEPAAMALENGW